jgi:hypothetical protein
MVYMLEKISITVVDQKAYVCTHMGLDQTLTCSKIFCRIFCAMGSKSMTTEQSTFMIDLHQVGTMLRYRGSDPEACGLIFQL